MPPIKSRNESTPLILRIMHSKIFLFVFLIIAIYLFINVYHQIEKRVKIKKEINNLESSINNLQSENTKLSNLINYFKTDEYLEASSREKLGYKKPGEKIIVFTKEGGDENKLNTLDKNKSNLKLWWEHFFVK